MPYNGDGEILKPIVIHNGKIQDKVQDYFDPNIGFVDTLDGKLNYDATLRVLEHIEVSVNF